MTQNVSKTVLGTHDGQVAGSHPHTGRDMDPKWSQNGSKKGPKRVNLDPKSVPKWVQNGPSLGPVRGPN